MDHRSIPGTSPVPYPLAPIPVQDEPLPASLTSPTPPSPNSKSIFAFWHSGISKLPPYLQWNVLAWYRRYAPLGWTIYVLDTIPESPLNVSRFIDIDSPAVVPTAVTNGSLDGAYAAQHTSDLVRYPLLLRYGGIYLDVGILQFGDLDRLWDEVIANPSSPHDFAGFTMGDPPDISIVNFALMARPNNPLVLRAHKILLKLWQDKTNTTGMHAHPLVHHVPLLRVPREVMVQDEGKGKMVIDDAAMTDYAIQIQAMGAAQRWLDIEDGWDGRRYVREKCWLLSMIDMAYVAEQRTGWDGQRLFRLMSLDMPPLGAEEDKDQRLAREIVEESVARSWCLKLGHGFSAKLFGGDTLGMLWRKHEGSDCRIGTYASWMRWAGVNCRQDQLPKPMEIPAYEPTAVGRLSDQV
ncbi:hypothetical protein W97_08386 [Coniosporium apollinis CBS 100218]|uniref:Capsule polysaccharide biosynthesis protein n=1 Tax=Coniosporium apollinis (strain CBS 100218) TaxID=1168221 RepID=R7Z4P7_CONA1|nr:uncharacterized protein W97_08386 [Coniosporium apollinis CBS 100218]EON69073.1 hypothetical protein W97_08386 [Coniosporium apollinis CBS 100218]